MSNKFDLRQSIYRGTLNQIGNQTNPEGDNLLNAINNQLTPLLRMSANSPASLVVNVGGGDLTDSETNRRRAIPHVGTAYVQFSSGTITFPSMSGGNITCSPGSSTVLTVASGNYAAVLVYLDSAGDLNVIVGADAATESAAVTNLPPAPSKTIGLGFIVVRNVSGTIQNITQNNIRQFAVGSGGGGSGDASSILEDLKNQLVDTHYSYLTAEDFSLSTDTVDDVNTTATFSLTTNTYNFTSGQKLTTSDLLDESFWNAGVDIDQAMVTLRYAPGFVNSNPTVKLTRDNGVTWQTVNVSRNGSTDEVSGIIDFASETLTTSASYTTTGNRVLNTASQQKLAQILTIPSATLRLVKNFSFDVNKTGSPNGVLTVKLVKEASGDPSLALADIISAVEVSIPSISSGISTLNIDFGNRILTPGNYYLLLETDAAYANSFSSGVTQLAARINSSTPNARAYDGTSWSTVSGDAIPYQYTYKNIVLKLEVTATATSRLLGYGVLYSKSTELVSPVAYDPIIVGSAAQVSAGIATHSSLQSAVNDAGFSRRVRVLAGVITENVTISQSDILIEGDGRGSVLNGTLTISGNNNLLQSLKLNGNITLSGNYNTTRDAWIGNVTITDNGTDNSINGIWES